MTVEEAIRAKLLTLSAVTAITTTIRPNELLQSDTLPAIIVSVDDEDYLNDLSGTAGLVDASVTIMAVSRNTTQAWALADAIKKNGTDPGTGLAGFTGTAGTLSIKSYLNRRTKNNIADEDGKDTGVISVDSIYTVWYSETV